MLPVQLVVLQGVNVSYIVAPPEMMVFVIHAFTVEVRITCIAGIEEGVPQHIRPAQLIRHATQPGYL